MGLKQMVVEPVEIAGVKYYILPFPAFKSANVSGELASVLGPLLGVFAPLLGETKSLMDVDASKAAAAMANIQISGSNLEKLMKTLLLGGHISFEIEGEEAEKLTEDAANELFCGDVQDMFVLCFHVIKLNFNGFFKRFAGLSGKVQSAKGQRKKL